MFICPNCKGTLRNLFPELCACAYQVPQIASVYQFCADPPISLEHEGRKYLGYEMVGENYEGPQAPSPHIDNDYGIFGGCARKLVELLGRECVVLDLGAGLGPASITLAMAGATTIAADISQKMLSIAAKRASQRRFDGSLVFARMNAYDLPIVDNCIDAVVAIDVLHQLDNPDTAVREIIRVLKPNGILVEYGSRGLPISQEQMEVDRKCSSAFKDIQDFYRQSLAELGYTGLPFSSWDKVTECFAQYFEQPNIIDIDSDTVWTGKMAKGIHKLATRASGSAQLIPDAIHNAAWGKTDAYAISRYGKDYRNLPGYSRYSGLMKVYKRKSC